MLESITEGIVFYVYDNGRHGLIRHWLIRILLFNGTTALSVTLTLQGMDTKQVK